MKKKKQISLLVLGLMITIGMVVGVTYALWQVTLQQRDSNVITTGCFDVTLEEGEAITLNNAYPMTDEEGSSLTPYTFTIKNNCSEKASYVLNLETVSSGEKILSDEYVKTSLKNNDTELFLSTLDSTNENLEKVIAEASKAYKLTEGVLRANEEKTFELRLWMDEDTPTMDEVMNASFMGKITISSSYVPYKPSNRMVAMDMSIDESEYVFVVNNTYTKNRKYQDSITKIVFQNKMNPYENATEIVDFSEEKDESVLGYYVPNQKENESDSDIFILYIQADGKIKVNSNASYYFITQCYGRVECQLSESNNALFEGIENLDTSEVTDMSHMFYMFAGDTLDLSNFNTAKVTNMNAMFQGAGNLNHLDLSSLDTANVTDMSYMFYRYNGELLNLSNIDTSNVTNMDSMFGGAKNLTDLEVNHFDTSKVTNMASMFWGMESLTNLDVSHFDTNNVMNMRGMFSNDSQLKNITYGDKFIHKEGANIAYMLSGCPANKPTHSSWSSVTW